MKFHISVVMDSEESGPRLLLVNPTIPTRVQARSRADSRLQSMTLGAAALGIAATGVFGFAAAFTYTGSTTTVNAADQQGGLDGQGVDPTSNTGTSGQTNQSGTQGGTVSPFSRSNQQPITPPTITRHRSHAVTGGS